MIPIYTDPNASTISTVEPTEHSTRLTRMVSAILAQVKQEGDGGLRAIMTRLGDPVPESFRLPQIEMDAALARIPQEQKEVLDYAAQNIKAFANAVMSSAAQPVRVDHPGFSVGLDFAPVERVGCYVPGGRYPLPSTALMTALTAQAARVQDIVIVSPRLPDTVIYAGHLAGVKDFYTVGGAQAVAALAYGTESIPKVDMVVGPGNAYVTEAKRQLQGVIGIDMLAGPSEVGILADSGANPDWLALDLLAQAEHDPSARVYLWTTDAELAKATQEAISRQLKALDLPDFLESTLSQSAIWVLPTQQACIQAINAMAPEHLELQVADPERLKPLLNHYGALFMGYGATVPMGDYAAGPNHTLPTARSARFSGSLNPMTFLRAQSWLHPMMDHTGAQTLAQTSGAFAQLEGLTAHGAAALARVKP